MRNKLAVGLVLAMCAGPAVAADLPAQVQAWQIEWSKTDFTKMLVDYTEIRSGGPPKDGIPAIDKPAFRKASKDEHSSIEPVVSLAIKGDARAYPVAILMWHEIVNDTVGGVPVSVTFCPLCNTSIVFERTIDGKETTFGTTGKLRMSDLVMYDRASESWWQQFSGQAIVGQQAGKRLKTVPARLESFEAFLKRHPDGKIQAIPEGFARNYGLNPYSGYDSQPAPYFPVGDYDGPVPAMARVVAVDGKAWSLDFVREKGRIEDGNLVITWTAGQASALDTSIIARGRDVGNVVVQRRVNGKFEDTVYELPFAFSFAAFNPGVKIVTN